MRLGLDLESTGLLRDKLPLSDASQPSICQIGAILYDMDWNIVGKHVSLIRPEGWHMEPEAEAHHGISETRCAQYGVPIAVALLSVKAMTENAIQWFAHNANFERQMITAQLAKLGADDLWWRKKGSAMVCTMEGATIPCALPNDKYPGFKWPTLEEAMRRFYPELAHPTKHEAEADVMDAALIAQALIKENLWPSPFQAWMPKKA